MGKKIEYGEIVKQDDKSYFYVTIDGESYKVTAYGTEYVGIKSDDEIELEPSEIAITQDPLDWTKSSVKITIKVETSKIQDYEIQYKTLSDSDWENYSGTFSVEKNCTIKVRLKGINADSSEITKKVENIDKLAPRSFTPKISTTTNTVTVTANTTDQAATADYGNSGIAGYRFSKDNGATWTAYQSSGTYTYNGLTQNTNYTIKVEAKDNTGNTTQASASEATGEVPSNITVSYSTTEWTNGNVTVTAKANTTGYTLQYNNGTTWVTYPEAGVTLTKNGSVDFRLFDGTNGGNNVTGTVGNIDKLAPNNFTPTATSTTNSITVTASTTDQAKTTDNGSSGILGYRFSKDNGSTWTAYQASGTYTYNGLTQKQSYTIKVEAKDNAGNTTQASVTKTTGTVPSLATTDVTFTYTPSTETNSNVKTVVKSNKDTTGYTLQYKTSKTGKSGEISSWTTYPSAGVTLTRNQDIYVRIADSTGQASGTYATGTIANIDKLAPNSFTPNFITGSYNMLVIQGSTTDQNATSDYSSSGIAGYAFSKDNGATWTAYQTAQAYQFTGLTENTTYTMKIKAKDKAGNETISSALQKTTSKQTYTVTYNANGGSGAPSSQTKTKGTALTLSSTKPTRTGYTFQGWTKTKDSGKVDYKAGATYSTDANVTLYAVWTEVITFSNGTEIAISSMTADSNSSSVSTSANLPAGTTIRYKYVAYMGKEFGGSVSCYANSKQLYVQSKAVGDSQLHHNTQLSYTTTSTAKYTFSLSLYRGAGTSLECGGDLEIISIVDQNGNTLEFN